MIMQSNFGSSIALYFMVSTYLVSTAIVKSNASYTSTPNMTVDNETRKYGMFYIPVGKSVNIRCTVTSSAYNVSRLVIYGPRDKVITNVTQVDDVSVQVTVTSTVPDTYAYQCCVDQCPPRTKYEPQRVAGVTLQYADPNVSVHDFACVSPDYTYVNCSWRIYDTSERFSWNMTFCVEGFMPQRLSYLSCHNSKQYSIDCQSHQHLLPHSTPSNDRVYSCQIMGSNFLIAQTYRINVTGTSVFATATGGGRVKTGIPIVQYSPMQDLKLVGPPSFTSLTVNWSQPVFIWGALPQYRLTIWEHYGNEYVGVNFTNRTSYTLTDLTPATAYRIQVQAKPTLSPFWSTPNIITVTTNETGFSGNSDTPNQSNIGPITAVSILLALIVCTCVLCFVHHRKRLCSLKRIPIEIPRMIQTEQGVSLNVIPCDEVRETSFHNPSDPDCQYSISESVSAISVDYTYRIICIGPESTCNGESQESILSTTFSGLGPECNFSDPCNNSGVTPSSDANPGTDTSSHSSSLTTPLIISSNYATWPVTKARQGDTFCVPVDSIANQVVVTNQGEPALEEDNTDKKNRCQHQDYVR